MRTPLDALRPDGVPRLDGLPTFGEFTDLIGLPDIQELERRFTGPRPALLPASGRPASERSPARQHFSHPITPGSEKSIREQPLGATSHGYERNARSRRHDLVAPWSMS